MNNTITPLLFKVNNHQKNYGFLDGLGVSHDQDKYLSFTKKSKQLKNEIIKNLKIDFMFDDDFKTYLYLAAGHEKLERFSVLPFNNIICVDYQIENYRCIQVADNKKIYAIPTDAITALYILRQVIGVKRIDVLEEFNSGENLGFGSGYSLSSQLVLSTGLPIFNSSQLIVITSKNYQKKNCNYQVVKNFYKLGFNSKTELKADKVIQLGLHIDNELHTLYPHSSSSLEFYLLQNLDKPIEKVFDYQGKSIHLIHGNLFDRIDEFDISFLIFRSYYQYTHFHNNYQNVMDVRASYRFDDEVLDFNSDSDLSKAIDKMGCKKVAFIPQNNPDKDWVSLIDKLVSNSTLTDIYFYHINKDDFKQLYKLFDKSRNSNCRLSANYH